MKPRLISCAILKRYLIFNTVGAMGIGVQMAVLIALTSGLGLHYLPAAGLAVEAAVVHNFFWHEHWTWADRRKNGIRGLLLRFLLFHGTNGVLSLAGNIILMHFLVERLGLHYLLSNASAIALCSVLNFLAGDRIIFRVAEINPRAGGVTRNDKNPQPVWMPILLLAALLPGPETARTRPGLSLAHEFLLALRTDRRGCSGGMRIPDPEPFNPSGSGISGPAGN